MRKSSDKTKMMQLLHVAPDGCDTWSGTCARPNRKRTDGPFASLEAARDAIRRLRAGAGLPAGGVVVQVAGGDYLRTSAFCLTVEDSGTAEAPIVYRGVGRRPARLLGGKMIRRFSPVTDPAIRARLAPSARANVRQVDLKAMGISDFGEMKSRGFGRPFVPAALELFFDHTPMPLARWPNIDFTTISAIPAHSSTDDGWGGAIGTLANGFHYHGDRIKRWQPSPDIWIHGYWCWDWANSYEHVAGMDPDTGHIKTAPPHGLYGFKAGQRFFFLNILEELDQPGEWYLDRATGILYFWPPAALARKEVMVSLLAAPLIELQDVSDVHLVNLAFEATRAEGIRITRGSRVQVMGCVLRNIGNYGVVIAGGTEHRIQSCTISHTGDGCVNLSGGDRATLAPCQHSVVNCHFHHFSRWSKCYCPAINATGVGMRFAHNRMHDAPHTAILFTGNEFLIEFNEIYNVCMETGDAGAIYTGRDYTFRGNVVRHNFIHHMGGVGMGTMGVYNDDCVSGTVMTGNVFYRVTRACMLGGGRELVVTNNLFVDCRPAINFDSRGASPHPVWHGMVFDYMRKQAEKVNYRQPPYSTRYPELQPLARYFEEGKGIPPENTQITRNICSGGEWLCAEGGQEAVPLLGMRSNLVTPRPLAWKDIRRLDFRFRNDARARRIGFVPIPHAQIGLVTDTFRVRVPARQMVHAYLEVQKAPGITPTGKRVPAQLAIVVENCGQAASTGSVGLWLNPAEAASIGGKTLYAYRLGAGRTARIPIAIALAPPRCEATIGLYKCGEDYLRHHLVLTLRRSVQAPRLPTPARDGL